MTGQGGDGHRARLLSAIEARTARVGIIGLGYVGLPLARAFAEAGYPVLGFDTDPAKVERLARGESYIGHIPDAMVGSMLGSGFEATGRFERLDEPDAVVICVPTPLTDTREPDLTYVVASAEAVADRLRPGQLVVLESTTYPGTTRDVLRPELEAGGLVAGRDFFLAYSPEREDPGNPSFSAGNDPQGRRRVGTAASGKPWPAPSTGGRPAGRRGVDLRGRRGLQDPREHVPGGQHRAGQRAEAGLRPDGDRRLGGDRRGEDQAVRVPGLLPRPRPRGALHPDRPVLSRLGSPEEVRDESTRFIELAGEINTSMPAYVVGKVADALNDRAGRSAGAGSCSWGWRTRRTSTTPASRPGSS